MFPKKMWENVDIFSWRFINSWVQTNFAQTVPHISPHDEQCNIEEYKFFNLFLFYVGMVDIRIETFSQIYVNGMMTFHY